jgi:uncharacterized protein involved in outer membrane biogenesis
MRPVILIAVLAIVALAVGAALRYGAGELDGAVASTIERHGSGLTGTDVDVDGVDLALTAGRADLGGLTIGNPRGYETDYAVRIGSAAITLDIGSLTGDVPVIKELILDGALINAELRDAGSNLTDIQQHATASSGEPPAGEPGRIVVERFRVRDARVLVTSSHLSNPEELELNDVVVNDIGSASGGATYSEAAEAMLMPILAAARSAAADRLRSAAGEAVSDAAREELEEDSAELRNRADETRLELSEKVEGLLDRR